MLWPGTLALANLPWDTPKHMAILEELQNCPHLSLVHVAQHNSVYSAQNNLHLLKKYRFLSPSEVNWE